MLLKQQGRLVAFKSLKALVLCKFRNQHPRQNHKVVISWIFSRLPQQLFSNPKETSLQADLPSCNNSSLINCHKHRDNQATCSVYLSTISSRISVNNLIWLSNKIQAVTCLEVWTWLDNNHNSSLSLAIICLVVLVWITNSNHRRTKILLSNKQICSVALISVVRTINNLIKVLDFLVNQHSSRNNLRQIFLVGLACLLILPLLKIPSLIHSLSSLKHLNNRLNNNKISLISKLRAARNNKNKLPHLKSKNNILTTKVSSTLIPWKRSKTKSIKKRLKSFKTISGVK